MAAAERRFSGGSDDFESEKLDPRIQIELEKLNKASDDINNLELGLDEARAAFRQALTESTQKLNALSKKLGSCIQKARPYYDSRMRAKEGQVETHKAALRFEKACSMQAAAKEMVYLAEQGFFKKGQPFDPAWQEMLNHATIKVNEAEQERLESEIEHRKTTRVYEEYEQRVKELQKELKRSITKSSLSARRSLLQLNNIANEQRLQVLPYFELKAKFNQQLEDQKAKVGTLESKVVIAKSTYSEALRELESISDDIHRKRAESKAREELGVRSSGVGAESPPPPETRLNGTTSPPGLQQQQESRTFNVRERVSPPPIISVPSEDDNRVNIDDEYMSLPSRRNQSQGSDNNGHCESTEPRERESPPNALSSEADEVGTEAVEENIAVQTSTPVSSSPVKEKECPQLKISEALEPAKTEVGSTAVSPCDSELSVASSSKPLRFALHPNRSFDDLDDIGSDCESLADSIASAPMLEDYQIESLMLSSECYKQFQNTMEDNQEQASAGSNDWKRRTLPAKLSYLGQYLKFQADWVENHDRSQSEEPASSQDRDAKKEDADGIKTGEVQQDGKEEKVDLVDDSSPESVNVVNSSPSLETLKDCAGTSTNEEDGAEAPGADHVCVEEGKAATPDPETEEKMVQQETLV